MPLNRPYPHHQQPASSVLTAASGGSPFPAAFHELAMVVERYAPLHRAKGINTFGGHDLIEQKEEGLPLSKVGVLVVAARKLRQWEIIVGDAFKKTIDEQKQFEDQGEDALGLMMAARSHTSTPPAYETANGNLRAKHNLSASEAAESTVVVSKAYLQRLELENHLYRRHLGTYEMMLAHKWTAIITKHVNEAVKESDKDVVME
ncbi:MAG: hypothetical protein M1836_000367 [Candelina mexicana]|nr:MAG: hypothetical protein M1836_000367 [Candelina mexicana]